MPYRERLTVPLAWWVLAALFALSLLLAVGWYLGPVWGFGVAAAGLAAAAGLFVALAVVIRVDQDQLRIGRSVTGMDCVGAVAPLDAEQASRRAGVEADARAHLVLRPYIATAVELTLDDADDPVPYWLVSSRHPEQFAAAVRTAAATRRRR